MNDDYNKTHSAAACPWVVWLQQRNLDLLLMAEDADDADYGDNDNLSDDHDGDDLYIIGAVCDEKVTSSLICSATVAGEIYI